MATWVGRGLGIERGAGERNIFASLLVGGIVGAASYDLLVIDHEPLQQILCNFGVLQI